MQKMTKCIYCNADITYSEDAEYLVCMYCGRQMEVPGYKEEQEVKNLLSFPRSSHVAVQICFLSEMRVFLPDTRSLFLQLFLGFPVVFYTLGL